MSAMTGARLAHYEITGHLGSGGMGEVYQAADSKLGRRVAIKLLPAVLAADAERLAFPARGPGSGFIESPVILGTAELFATHIFGRGADAQQAGSST